ncbi:hypothetical protein HD806DRAFT_551608 [Xylariaceae sp. AK1471]|nr:hypothetical protein HD806DRAFT_551608 [Xylariaceae sp. AK1471]
MPPELVYQHHQQTPINGTISGMAPPGNETGYYYIPIANLPWQTSWQELKDHVRTVCSVEHVEISEDSTSGHVVLEGRANFDAAFRLLNGGIFRDRALIADGRNADSWVLVKQHVCGSTPSPQSPKTSRYRATPAQYTSSLMPQASPGYCEWRATSASSFYMMNSLIVSSSGFVPCTMPDHTTSVDLYGMGNCALEHSRTLGNSAAPDSSVPGYMQHYATSEYSGINYIMPNNDMTPREGIKSGVDPVPPKKRKIIIRQLQPWANESQIRDLIRYKAGSDAEKLQKLDIPLVGGQQGSNRGYALATFETEEAADKVIERLNNCQYDGRVLEAKHTKEGVSDNPPSHSSRSHGSVHQRQSRHSHHSRRDYHDDKDIRGKYKESSHKAANFSEKKSKSSSSKPDVVIAHGSSLSYV